MAKEVYHLEAVLRPGRALHAADVVIDGHGLSYDIDIRRFAEEALRQAGIVQERDQQQAVAVEIYSLTLQGGRVQRQLLRTLVLQPPVKPRTAEEFHREESELLAKLPEAFRGMVGHSAWERGHSSGYDEVLLIANELVYDLLPAIKTYAETLRTSWLPELRAPGKLAPFRVAWCTADKLVAMTGWSYADQYEAAEAGIRGVRFLVPGQKRLLEDIDDVVRSPVTYHTELRASGSIVKPAGFWIVNEAGSYRAWHDGHRD